MRHRNKRSKLSIMTAHRKAMLRAMVANLFKYQRIEMTLARAKETRRLAEHVITMAKDNTVASRRRVYAVIADRDLVKKLFNETVPLFKNKTSGFTRIIHTGFRRGDGADMALLELTEKKIIEKLPAKKSKKSEEPKAGAEGMKAKDAPKKDAKKEIALEAVDKTEKEEKRAEKARAEDKKIADNRGFMKNIRGLFRKRGDF
jgi:large subunit ribosomal protein L17